MKKTILLTLLAIISINSQANDDSKNNWEKVKGKVLSDLLYKDGGKLISAQNSYYSGHYVLYHVMVNNTLFKCADELDDSPVNDGVSDETNCYKLVSK